ncbi:MAG: hypothetical protein ABIP81_02765 [Terriglobales bacterium]
MGIQKSRNDSSSSENTSTANLFSRVEAPHPFTSDWHHQFGAKLCAFPRFLVLPLEVASADGSVFGRNSSINLSNFQFWPDLATFVEGERWSALMYYPGPSRASACVIYWQDVPRWEIVRFDDEDVVAKGSASSYEDLMRGNG